MKLNLNVLSRREGWGGGGERERERSELYYLKNRDLRERERERERERLYDLNLHSVNVYHGICRAWGCQEAMQTDTRCQISRLDRRVRTRIRIENRNQAVSSPTSLASY